MPLLPTALSALHHAARAYREVDAAVAHTRLAIVALGAQLSALVAELPVDDVATIGLGVGIVIRGEPVAGEPAAAWIEYLPGVDDETFEVRPGAASLFLEAGGHGQARAHLEIRSSPGQIVLATSSARELDDWLEDVRGIVVDADSRVRLVRVRRTGNDGEEAIAGPDAPALLEKFLESVQLELKRRARFNRGVDL